jgi:hypothetical protein
MPKIKHSLRSFKRRLFNEAFIIERKAFDHGYIGGRGSCFLVFKPQIMPEGLHML